MSDDTPVIKRPEALDPPLARPLDEDGAERPLERGEDIFPFGNPQFSGGIHHLKTLVESQEPMIRKIMSSTTSDMLDIRDEMLHYVGVLKEYDGNHTYVDQHDPTNSDGTEKSKSFIPRSLRKELPIHFTNKVRRDGRLKNTHTAILAELVEARKTHDRHKEEMARHVKKVAELELEGRTELMNDAYDKTTVWLAEALVEICMTKVLKLRTQTPKFQIAVAAIATAIRDYPEEHWVGLNITKKQQTIATDDQKTAWWEGLQKKCGVNYDSFRFRLLENDRAIAALAADKLKELIPAMTTTLWKQIEEDKTDKIVDGNLIKLFGKKRIDEANRELNDAMETEQGETVKSLATEAVREEASKKKKRARKKYSGGNKIQEPTPTENGQTEKRKSKEKKKSPKKQSKPPGSSHNSSSRHQNNSNLYSHSRGSQGRGRERRRGRGSRGK